MIIASLLIYLLLIPIFVIQGYSFSYFIFSVDMCKESLNSISNNLEPRYEKGIGYFIRCPAKNVRKDIYTSKYILSNSFDNLIKDVNKTLITNNFTQGLGYFKRNNTLFNVLADKTFTYNDNNITVKTGLKSLVQVNKILYGLESLSQCEYGLSTINYLEEKFCYENLDNESFRMIYYLIGAIGIIFVTVGLNKLSVFVDETSKKVIFIILIS